MQPAQARLDALTNWDDYRIFLSVARYESLDAAASQLSQDPTTLGRRIRRLEASIGATLFERSRRGHVLTSSGEWLLSQVEKIDHIVAGINESLSGEVEIVSGTVRLSVTEAFGNVVIAPALTMLLQSYPALKIELVASSGFLSVSKREADMAIMLSRPTSGRLKISKLTDYKLKLYASPKYLAKQKTKIRVDQLHEQCLIGYVDDLIYSPSLRYYDEIATGLQPNITSSSLLAQQQLAISGAGIAMLPKFVGAQSPNLEVVLEQEVTVTRSFWLAIHEDVHKHARIRVVTNFLNDLVEKTNLILL